MSQEKCIAFCDGKGYSQYTMFGNLLDLCTDVW